MHRTMYFVFCVLSSSFFLSSTTRFMFNSSCKLMRIDTLFAYIFFPFSFNAVYDSLTLISQMRVIIVITGISEKN